MSETTYSPEFASLQRVVAGRYSLVREIKPHSGAPRLDTAP